MKKIRIRTFISLLCAVLLLTCCAVLMQYGVMPKARAASGQFFTPEQYTDDDRLLLPDGTYSTRKIDDFATTVKQTGSNEAIPELPQVIPTQYLKTADMDAVYAYNGKEYGFYIRKHYNQFDLLLIDFSYESDDDRLVYEIRINPILQATFYSSIENGQYVWRKAPMYNTGTYYVANPRFATILYNENALNYGDDGYSKYDDDGLIVREYRTNYGTVHYATEEDYNNTVKSFIADIAFDLACPALNLLTLGTLGTSMQICKTLYEESRDLYNIGAETTVKRGSEKGIKTSMTKQAQHDAPDLPGYSRVASFAPRDEIVLSDAEDSYAEFVTLLEGATYKSRLVQLCEFDIALRETDYSSAEYVTGANDEGVFRFYKEQILFDNALPKFEVDTNDIETKTIQLYVFPRGEQEVSLTPKYTGVYNFEKPDNAILLLNNNPVSSCTLQAGQKYTFKIVCNANTKVIGNLRCTFAAHVPSQQYSVPANTNVFVRYISYDDDYKKITTSNGNVQIGLLDENFNTLVAPTANKFYYQFSIGKKYYFVVKNNSNTQANTNVTIDQLDNISLGTYEFGKGERCITFTNIYSTSVDFQLIINHPDKTGATVTDKSKTVLSTSGQLVGDKYAYNFSLLPNQICYIQFSGNATNDSAADLRINPNQFRWVIDGKIEIGPVRLKPNASHSVALEVISNGIKATTINDFIVSTSLGGEYYGHSKNTLRIGNVANGMEITLIPAEAPDSALIVIVDNMLRDIKLMRCDGTNNYETITAEIDKPLPQITEPTRNQYKFLGYYTERNGQGVQYISSNMEGSVWDKYEKENTLYAHWVRVAITVTFDNGSECSDRFYYADAVIGAEFTGFRLSAPKREGYAFDGYYTGTNGTGNKYYSMELVNDEQTAAQYGFSEYIIESIKPVATCVSNDKITLYASWKLLECDYLFLCVVPSEDKYLGHSTTHLKHMEDTEVGVPIFDGYTFQRFGYNASTSDNNKILKVVLERKTDGKICPKYEFNAIYEKSCVAEGTLITLADGRQVPVEELTGDEMLLVWNLYTGTYGSASILFIDKDNTQIYSVINLTFSDGTTVKVISEHGFWDYDLNKFVYLDSNASQYVGHWFNKGDTRVQLTAVDIRDEYTTAYSPVTAEHLCYFVNGMLSMPGGISGLFNIFEVDPNTMQYDVEAMEQDIAEYGLFTYEEFCELVPVPEVVFSVFNGQYFKVAIGKGLITVEQIGQLVERYAQFFDGIAN